MRRPISSANGSARVPRAWAGDAATEYLTDVRETDAIYAREGLGHPGLLQRVMNKVLVDNAILGPWIHVGSRMQLLSASAKRRRTDRAREGHRQLREEGPSLRRTRRACRRQRQHAAGALPAHRDLSAARAGGGVGTIGVAATQPSYPRSEVSSTRASSIHHEPWNTGSPASRTMTCRGAPHAAFAFASWIARQTRSGVSGMSISRDAVFGQRVDHRIDDGRRGCRRSRLRRSPWCPADWILPAPDDRRPPSAGMSPARGIA